MLSLRIAGSASLVHAGPVFDTVASNRQAYKRAALKYHPDKVPREERDEAERKFKQARPPPLSLQIKALGLE